ncbi:hypothetical protein CEXT_493191 [Caerostris extrusa]|uniref:Uncharacterized protein n=1 Tax=Caerostris extrusa TaxID=172846 RepID=A0AAV4VZ86_CAEEX|nr:hypothetical protein CEXT_493191 [Caerostris extrusa]
MDFQYGNLFFSQPPFYRKRGGSFSRGQMVDSKPLWLHPSKSSHECEDSARWSWLQRSYAAFKQLDERGWCCHTGTIRLNEVTRQA